MYQYRGTQTIAAEQERQEQLRRELAEERNRLKEAMRIRRENDRLEAEILRTQQRAAELAKPSKALPEPVHGGQLGLMRACAEVAEYEARKRKQAA